MDLEIIKQFLPNTLPELTSQYNQTLPPIKRLSTRQLASKLKSFKEIKIKKKSNTISGYNSCVTIYDI